MWALPLIAAGASVAGSLFGSNKQSRTARDVAEAQQAYLRQMSELLKKAYGETSEMFKPYMGYAAPAMEKLYAMANAPMEDIRQQYLTTSGDIAKNLSARGLLGSGSSDLAFARAATEAAAQERGVQRGLLGNIYNTSYGALRDYTGSIQEGAKTQAGLLGQMGTSEANRLGALGNVQQGFMSDITNLPALYGNFSQLFNSFGKQPAPVPSYGQAPSLYGMPQAQTQPLPSWAIGSFGKY